MKPLLLILLLSLFAGAQKRTGLSQQQTCAKFSNSVVRIDVPGGRATGFIVSSDGWIATANHVIFDETTHVQRGRINVHFADGSSSDAEPAANTPQFIARDFALVKVEGKNLPALILDDQGRPQLGSDIAVIGYPFSSGLAGKFCLSGQVAPLIRSTKTVLVSMPFILRAQL